MTEGYHAYSEFLVGLSKINQSEFVYHHHSGFDLRSEKLATWSTVSGLWDLGCWSARSRLTLSMRLAHSKERQRKCSRLCAPSLSLAAVMSKTSYMPCPFPLSLRKQGPNMALRELGPKGVHDLANWERQILYRSEVRSKMKFHENLLRRSRMSLDKKFEICTTGIPIRRETYKLLTRPPEPDFTWVGMILQLVFMINFWVAVIFQLIALTEVCADPFFCPMRGADLTKPMVAPPAKFRSIKLNTTQMFAPTFTAFSWPWNPVVKSGDNGFLSEWPYFQTHHGVDEKNSPKWYSAETIAKLQELASQVSLPNIAGCSIEKTGDEGFVWDPFEQMLREEFYKCDGANVPWGEGGVKKGEIIIERLTSTSGIPGNATDSVEYMSKVTFNYGSYKQRMKFTTDCMRELQSKCTKDKDFTPQDKYCVEGQPKGQGTIKAWWERIKTKFPSTRPESTKYNSEVAEQIGSCVAAKVTKSTHLCDCHEKAWNMYPLTYFYQGSDRIMVCEGGEDIGKVCQPARNNVIGSTPQCKPKMDRKGTVLKNFKCVENWKDSLPIGENFKYGCFFSSPTSQSELQFEYKKCNMNDKEGTINTNGGSLTLDQAKSLLDVNFSKRAALVLIFLFKECGYLSAAIVVAVVLLLLLGLFIVLSPILGICYVLMTGKTEGGLQTRLILVNLVGTVYGLIANYVLLIWIMVCNLSTMYRSFVMMTGLVRFQVNKSLLDMDQKFTTVSNIIYTLVMIIVIDDTTSGGGAKNTTTGLGAALATQLFSLFFKMVQEKVGLASTVTPLKDLNENRLSKFEMALLLIKIMEDLLPDDIQYNWVQNFNSKEPLMPDFNHPQYQVNDVGEDESGIFDEGHFDGLLWTCVAQDPDVRKNVYMQPLDAHLANRFGHDGQGFDYNPRFSKQLSAVQTVKLNQDNLIEFMPGEYTLLV